MYLLLRSYLPVVGANARKLLYFYKGLLAKLLKFVHPPGGAGPR
jgi:hypothetical protein